MQITISSIGTAGPLTALAGCCRDRQRCTAVISTITQMFGLTNINAAQIQTNCSLAHSFQWASCRLIFTAEAVHRLLKTSNRTPQVYTDREVHSSSPT